MRIFTPSQEAILLDRPNRFLARIQMDGRMHEAHFPNPAILQELILPGTRVILEEQEGAPNSSLDRRRTRFTVVAVYYRDRVVPIVSSRANRIAENLIIPRLYPESLRIEREVSCGSSRFDFRIVLPKGSVLLEVKCCTLVEEGTALFPDAPTARGRRHLEELARHSSEKGKSAVLFLIMQPQARLFMPNVHTDPAFSQRLIELAPHLRICASSVRASPEGEASLEELSLPVGLETARFHLTAGGAYLLIMEIQQNLSLVPGSLALTNIRKGFYVYTGSAMRNLESRINRHKRKRKKVRWHIDYLSPLASKVTAIAFRSAHRLECDLAQQLKALSDERVLGFGCSDCSCDSHLFYFKQSPLKTRAFIDLIGRFRHREAFGNPAAPL
jgi:sugar fermentation stimulation protein A